jgi:hypothetical protein
MEFKKTTRKPDFVHLSMANRLEQNRSIKILICPNLGFVLCLRD